MTSENIDVEVVPCWGKLQNLTPPISDSTVDRGSRKVHFPYLDGIRGVAALVVMLGHLWCHILPKGVRGPDWYPLSADVARVLTKDAVAVFIVLSGFCLCLPVAATGSIKGGARGFFARRARRILLPYYASLAVYAVLFLAILGVPDRSPWNTAFPLTWQGLLSHLTFTQNIVQPGTNMEFTAVLWSVAVEEQIYLWFPLLVLAFRRFGLLQTAVPLFLGAMIVHSSGLGYPVPELFLQMYGCFLVGCVAAHVKPSKSHGLAALLLVGAAVAYSVGRSLDPDILKDDVIHVSLVAMAMASFMIYSRTRVNSASRLLESRPFVWLGVFSYSLYLMHHAFQAVAYVIITKLPHESLSKWIALHWVLGASLSIAGAYIFHLVFEKPTLRRNSIEPQRPSGALATSQV